MAKNTNQIIDGININEADEPTLREMLKKYHQEAGFFETQQLAIKTFINSVYGATASAYFVGYNNSVAEAITLQGQDLNHFSEISVNNYFKGPFQADTELHKKLGIKTEDTQKISISGGKVTPTNPLIGPEFSYLNGETDSMVVAGDTDSFTGDTMVYLNNIKCDAKSAFDMLKYKNNHVVIQTTNGQEVIPVKDTTTKTYTLENGVIDKPIKYIMRHKVNKGKWKLKTKSGKEITVTEDHSLMVLRNNKLIDIKAKDINIKTDKIVSLKL